MGIVRFALRWPYTYYVSALLILFLGVTAFRSMPADIFPEIDIPVVTVIWQYTGLSTPEMEQRVTSYSEYAMSTNAQTLNGISVQKVYFQSDVNFDLAIAQIISATNYIRVLMPAGIQAPLVVQYNASGFPVLQISLSSDTVSGQQLYDYGLYNLRQRLAPIHGVTFPTPAGGKYRQIMVDLDPAKLLAKGLTPLDVVNAVNAPEPGRDCSLAQYRVDRGADKHRLVEQLLDLHAGRGRSARDVERLLDLPDDIDSRGIAVLDDAQQDRTPAVRPHHVLLHQRAVADMADVVGELDRNVVQVVYRRRYRIGAHRILRVADLCRGRAKSGSGLMILQFLGSWRSTLVVMISIPLSVLSSLIVLYSLGDTLNTMTLGGLALAIGILVDDSTVTIENTHRLLTEEGQPLPQATFHGAAGIAVPTLGRHWRSAASSHRSSSSRTAAKYRFALRPQPRPRPDCSVHVGVDGSARPIFSVN